jgi:hypothetical protein
MCAHSLFAVSSVLHVLVDCDTLGYTDVHLLTSPAVLSLYSLKSVMMMIFSFASVSRGVTCYGMIPDEMKTTKLCYLFSYECFPFLNRMGVLVSVPWLLYRGRSRAMYDTAQRVDGCLFLLT